MKRIKTALCLVIAGVMATSVLTASATAAATPGWEAIASGAQDSKGFANITGFTWNAPFNGHAHVGMTGNAETARRELAIFSYLHDGARETTLRADDANTPAWLAALRPEGQTMQNPDEAAREATPTVPDQRVAQLNQISGDTETGVIRFQSNFARNSFIIPQIISSRSATQWGWAPTDLKFLNETAPDVFFGAEFMPARSAAGRLPERLIVIDPELSIADIPEGVERDSRAFRANESRVNISTRAGNTVDEMVASYVAEQVAAQAEFADSYRTNTEMLTIARGQTTYGGASYYAARVGGVWDTMLSEGRRFWFFGAEGNRFGSNDALASMRAGNSFTAQGDLITALDFTVSSGGGSATMGQTLSPVKGQKTEVTVRFQGANVDHIDLIGGVVGDAPSRVNPRARIIEHPLHRLSDDFRVDSVDTTTIVKRFNKSEFKAEANGWQSVTFTVPASDAQRYFRVRGTSVSVEAAGYDAKGTPKADPSGGNGLWFYSNPIFVSTEVEDAVTVNGKLVNADGSAVANTEVSLVSRNGTVTATTNASGEFRFNNVLIGDDPVGTHTIRVGDSSLLFNLDRFNGTGFDGAFAWTRSSVSQVDMTFRVSGSALTIGSISETPARRPSGGGNPTTDASQMILITVVALLAMTVVTTGITPALRRKETK